MTKVVNNNKKAVEVQVKNYKQATTELNKVRKYNQYLNMQVDRLWKAHMQLIDEVAKLKATSKPGC